MSSSPPYPQQYFDQHNLGYQLRSISVTDNMSNYLYAGSPSSELSYKLKWRLRKLIVQPLEKEQPFNVMGLAAQGWLTARLKNSPVQLVKLDLALGSEHLQIWAEACHRSGKKAFLRIPSTPNRPQRKYPLRWWLKRQLDWLIAVIFLILLSPILLGLALLIRVNSSKSIFSWQWCIGERGKIFRCYQFRTVIDEGSNNENQATAKNPSLQKHMILSAFLEYCLKAFRLERLPMLFNVIRGEMSLVGLRPVTLSSVAAIQPELQPFLNAIPGVFSICQIGNNSNFLESGYIQTCNFSYLQNWSLKWDLKVLLMKIPKLFMEAISH